MRAAVFLDRDGTLIEEVNYLRRIDQIRVLPGVAESLRALREAGYALVLVTNQSGVARGYFSEEDLGAIHAELQTRIPPLDGLYWCPHHPEHSDRRDCACRKPGTELFERAARDLDLDLGRSWAVGDKPGDLQGAMRLGCRGLLVRTGHGATQPVPPGARAVDDFAGAARLILEAT